MAAEVFQEPCWLPLLFVKLLNDLLLCLGLIRMGKVYPFVSL